MKNTKQALVIPLDNGVIQSVKKEFSEHNEKTIKKIMFIVYLVKKGKYNTSTKKRENYFEISRTKIKTYLSLNKELSPIIDKLIELGIIAKKGGYINSVSYQKYTYIAKSTGKESEIFINRTEGKYVSRYIDDNYTVIYSSNKKVETPKEEISSTVVETPNMISIDEYNKLVELVKILSQQVKVLTAKQNNLDSDIETLFENDGIIEERLIKLEATTEDIIEESEECPVEVIEAVVEPKTSLEIEGSRLQQDTIKSFEEAIKEAIETPLIEGLNETEIYLVGLAKKGMSFYKTNRSEKVLEYICKENPLYENPQIRNLLDKCIDIALNKVA